MLEANAEIPIQEIQDEITEAHKVHLSIKREDLLDDEISGNKFRKLRYNLEQAQKEGYRTLLTFGGAYSNHIAAVAAAGRKFDMRTIGVIRGEEHKPLNETLHKAENDGMHLIYMDRETYRRKREAHVLDKLRKQLGDFYFVPEGGSNALAVKGCMEILDDRTKTYDVICCPVGTGGTLAGIVAALCSGQEAIGFSALKGGEYLKEEVSKLLEEYYELSGGGSGMAGNFSINCDWHFGGYAKVKPELMNFVNDFYKRTAIPLDYVYTAKAMFGIYEMIKQGRLDNRRVLMVHTGGLQGNAGMVNRYNR